MAQPSDKDGSSAQITENTCPKLNAAISEFEKLTEKHRLFTSGYSQATDKCKSKIAFQQYGDELISCLSVMRRLMEETESENKQLKQEKFLISTKIGTALGTVNREVEQLRAELQKQDRRLIELNSGRMKDISSSTDNYFEELLQTKAEKAEIQAKYEALNASCQELSEKSKNFDRLCEQVRSYKDDIVRANETINCINNERRRLKSEKHDLLGHLKEAHCIIEDKESELREFITNYEARMRESEQRVENITNEKLKWLEEKRLIASTTPAQIAELKRTLDEKDSQLKDLHTELADVKDQLTRLQQTLNYPVPKSDKQQMKRSPIPTIEVYDSSILSNSEGLAAEDSLATSGVSGRETCLSNSEVYTNHTTDADDLSYSKKRKRYSRLGLVRVFSRGKKKSEDSRGRQKRRPLSSLSNDGDNDVSDLVQIWQTNKTVPISQWKSPAVIAFLHVHLQMPMYTNHCMENVKSGKVLADMSDVELSKSLGIISYMHRRKIRLAIEDFRHPASVKYPKMGDIDHHFVAHDWLTHIGLSQYAFTFETQMVDGRLLSSLTRKDIEKYLNITSKCHQDSILFGVELLKHLLYDREILAKRKEKCDEYDHDPLVWSNERVIRWCDSINLKEYSSNLRSSGVFGGLLVFNRSFGPEELAKYLNIPSEKTAVRKHLVGELSSLMINARAGTSVKLRGRSMSRRSLRGRSKSFHRHSRRTGEYDVIGSSNDDEVNKLLEPNTRTQDALNVSPKVSIKQSGLAGRRSVTMERPKSTDCERNLVE